MTKNIYVYISSNILVRYFTKIITLVLTFFDRIWSHLKFRAFVVNAGKGTLCHWSTVIKYPENINIGNYTGINANCVIGARSLVTIGSYVRISHGVIIETAGLNLLMPPPYMHNSKPIIIEDGVWIAANCIILGGVTIGTGAIIGAGTVVSKSVPAGAIIVSSPNRILNPQKMNENI